MSNIFAVASWLETVVELAESQLSEAQREIAMRVVADLRSAA